MKQPHAQSQFQAPPSSQQHFEQRAHGVTVIEDRNSETELSTTVDVSKDTLALINTEVDNLDIPNPSKLKLIIRDLYNESLFI